MAAGLILGASILTGGTAAGGQQRPGLLPQTAPGVLDWRPCDQSYLCARLEVPLDYAQPDGSQIGLAVAERPATNPHPLGDLLLNPGGPGGSGVQFIEGASFLASLAGSYNLISWDPRGIGQSDPVECVSAPTLRSVIAADPAPSTPSQVAALVAESKQFVAACKANTPMSLLENVSTADTARDMDQLRAALGLGQLNYLGFSYGTYLGELYAEMFPTHVRAMVLDGVFDPALSVADLAAGQAAGFDLDLNDFFAWFSTNKTCSSVLPDPRSSYDQLMTGLADGGQVPVYLKPQFGGTEQLTLGLATTAVIGLLYSNQSWPDLMTAIADARDGDGSRLAAYAYGYYGIMANGQFDNMAAANAAIGCVDRGNPRQVSDYTALATNLGRVDPDFGADSAWNSLDCAFWPVPGPEQGSAVHVQTQSPLLLVGSTGDPATPYQWAKQVALQLGSHARLLTRTGPGHTGYFSSVTVSFVSSLTVTLS
jgi:pimeloyl-ACP methyl ester carboxylesterase